MLHPYQWLETASFKGFGAFFGWGIANSRNWRHVTPQKAYSLYALNGILAGSL